jgi:hypothetical protein
MICGAHFQRLLVSLRRPPAARSLLRELFANRSVAWLACVRLFTCATATRCAEYVVPNLPWSAFVFSQYANERNFPPVALVLVFHTILIKRFEMELFAS